MKKIFILFLIIIGTISVFAQSKKKINKIKVAPPICYASGKVEKAAIPPPAEILAQLKSGKENKSDIIVNYNNFPEDARLAFEYAVSIWENIIESDVPIYVHANWSSLGSNVLGSCGPAAYLQNFKNAPHVNRFYPIALAEKLTKREITGPGTPDITANFNKSVNWYFGTDLNTPDSLYDFATVVLHEMGHGLGFTGFFFVEDSEGSYGYNDYGDAAAFDLLVVKNNGDQLVDTLIFPNQSLTLKNALVSNSLYAKSPVAIADGGGYTPRLYAPSVWDDGSSVYHLNDLTYPSTNINSLMTHAIGKAEAVHNPGPITSGIMDDIGWKNLYINFDEVKDVETLQPFTFNVSLESDYELDSASLFVVYSTDSFQNKIDSIPLLPSGIPSKFSAELIPEVGTEIIDYYITAGDIKNRNFRLPTEAPKTLYSIKIGPDNEKPTIEFNPIEYYLLADENLKITANVYDNLGIDTVIIQYSINGIEQPSFGLKNDSSTIYSGFFNFDKNSLKDGDLITYNIIAKDASVAQNLLSIPFKSQFTCIVEEIYAPVKKYVNTFDHSTSDFILTDFGVNTESGFSNGALQSPHPYPSPKEDNSEFNFSTILKFPIIIQENGTMTFDEVVLVEPGEFLAEFGDAEFWDYVIVEGSKDLGDSWLPLIDGYDSREKNSWTTRYNENIIDQTSIGIGSENLYATREIGLIENGNFSVGDTILIRFRLFSDPFANGWGWAIDNLRIQVPVSSPITEVSPGNINLYPNPFSSELTFSFETDKNINDIDVEIYNLFGQKVKTVQFNNIQGLITEKIETNDLKNGLYMVSIRQNGQQILTKKIVKQTK